MHLENLLEDNWISLGQLDPSSLDLSYICDLSNTSTNKGLVIEQYVRQWFERSGLEMLHFPKGEGFRFETHKYGGINVRSDNRIFHEYDFIIIHEDTPHLIEVKSGKWRCNEYKIDRALKYGKKHFGENVPLRIMSPLHAEHKKQSEFISSKYPDDLVGFIDLGYKQSHLGKFMELLSKGYHADQD